MSNGFDTPSALLPSYISQVMARGYIAAGRYISGGGAWKHLLASEVASCAGAGFGLWLIDEGSGDLAQFRTGETGGFNDGKKASGVATLLGVPAGTPIFVGVDYAAQASDVAYIRTYMSGYQSGCMPYRAGLYADGAVASAVPTAVGDFVPGASSWPGTAAYLTSGKVALVQHPTTLLLGMSVDLVDIVDQSVLWFPGKNVAAPVTAPPVSSKTQTPVADATTTLEAWQTFLGVTADGIYGPETAAAFEAYFTRGAS